MSYEHYNQTLDESERFIWYANSRGYVFKRSKKTNKDYYLKGYLKGKFLAFKIHNKEYIGKNLIAQIFHKKYYKGAYVGLLNDDPFDISITNIYIYSQREHAKKVAHLAKAMPVIIKNNDEVKEFRSVRAAAKYLFVSYQTLLDYLKNDVKFSVLEKKDRVIEYAKTN